MSEHGADRLNRASHVAAACIQDSLLRDVALGLARLLDPPSQGGHDNLVLERFVDGELPPELQAFRSKACPVRNKRLGHNDLTTMQDMKRIAYGFTDGEVDKALTTIVALIEDAQREADPWIDEGEQAAAALLNSLPRERERPHRQVG